MLKREGFSNPPIVVSSPRVLRLHGSPLLRSLRESFGSAAVIRMRDGERYKSHVTLQRVYDGLIQVGADRRSWLIALGGGVVGDLAGFAAATFMRGIPLVNVPTTLLAQVDSAIGGKVGINVSQGKNLIGAFHQPRAVLSDIDTLRTLPQRERAAGLYEIVKCGAIRSRALLKYLEERLEDIQSCKPDALEHIILEASRVKAEIVSGDETESHLRMILNYGHTVGHALEAATEYRRFKHGEAVGWGMVAAVEFGREMDMLTRAEADRLVRLLHRIEKLPSLSGISAPSVWSALRRDKKFRAGEIRMVLLTRLGQAIVRDHIDPRHLRQFLGRFLAQRRRRALQLTVDS